MDIKGSIQNTTINDLDHPSSSSSSIIRSMRVLLGDRDTEVEIKLSPSMLLLFDER